jgi:hypothetical protein
MTISFFSEQRRNNGHHKPRYADINTADFAPSQRSPAKVGITLRSA